jgi:hypothetical protein
VSKTTDVSAVTPTEKRVVSPRLEWVVSAVDRGFPLLWIGLYLLIPVSGWADVTFESWFDQRRDLEVLRSVLVEGRADAIADDVIGPAYIAAAAAIHWIFGLGAQDALVALNRASYALSVAGALVLVRVLVRRFAATPPLVSVAAQFALVGLVFAAGTWHWSDVPWSHFFATLLAVSLYVVRFAPARASAATAALTGIVLALLALTRSFELVSLVLAWGIALGALALLRLSGPRRVSIRNVLVGGVGFLFATGAVYLATGKRDVFFLYGSYLDNQSGNLPTAEVAQTPTFSFELVPTKLVQLFFEPCYYSLCAVSDYAGGANASGGPLAGAAGNELLWRLPLAIQLPSLVLLPLCLVGVASLLLRGARHRVEALSRAREIRLLLEMTIAATGIVIGYASSTMTGSSHLQYGFARDFLLPALLSAIVATSLLFIGVWLLLERVGPVRLAPTTVRVSSESAVVVVAVVVAVGLVGGVAAARANGLPRIDSRKLGAVEYEASCRGGACDVTIAARTVSGRPISIPEPSTLTFGCGSAVPRFTLYADELSRGIRIDESCSDPRLVAAWPTVMGLPPGSYELGFVDVANVRP